MEEQLCAFLTEHPDTVLIIIGTLQMIRGASYDNTYAASSWTSYPSFFLERKNEGYEACIDEVSDNRTQPELLGGRIVVLLSELMHDRTEFIGTPTELAERIDPVGTEGITPKRVSRLILQSVDALRKIGISAVVRRSNGKRLIELRRAESDDAADTLTTDPFDPVGATCGE